MLPSKKSSMRPPPTRPQTIRAQSAAPSLPPRMQSGAASPADSMVSSQSASPMRRNVGTKRKERDFETETAEETNVHVVVRCRGRNEREVKENSGVVVATKGVKGNTVELSMGPSALSNKLFHFDRVFSPAADQVAIFDDVVHPLLDEILLGYNCTVFAYGQTGTGKTYTMSGDMSNTAGLLSDAAGIIPRVLYALFAKLESEESECSVKCSFIELYNEELRDLLSADGHTKLKIYDDAQKKGNTATMVQGMEESHINNAEAGIKLLQSGSHRRQVAATKCNDLSSRSHTVFAVTVYMKRTTDTGEDFLSAGKLNLVDLAGSENIQRSGAENKRAAEAGLINKSLLTLGRVINALVERSSHIPYRESKLTRLLQDSLGGRTRTCIIATISPAKANLEETISTLDYAFRAKNIKNKPQVNQMISKKTLLKEFTAEIEKLKSELIATRQRNGVYLTNETYEEITVESESRRILSEEQAAKIETMEVNLRNKVQELFSLTNNFSTLKKDNEATKSALDSTSEVLEKTEIVLADTRQNLADETRLRQAHQATEGSLYTTAGELVATVHQTVQDVEGLHAKISRKVNLQATNQQEWQRSQGEVTEVTRTVEANLERFQSDQSALLRGLSERIRGYVQSELRTVESNQSALEEKSITFHHVSSEVLDQTAVARDEMNTVLEEIKVLREDVQQNVRQGMDKLSNAAERISAGVITELEAFHTQLQTSYSSLGRDFRQIFDDLVKHLSGQKVEIETLRTQLSSATQSLLQSESATQQKLATCLEEEKSQAAKERQGFLKNITDLIGQSAQQQEERWSSRIDDICGGMESTRSAFTSEKSTYDTAMDQWSQEEASFVAQVSSSREAIKNKLKKDWTVVNDHNATIQATTKAVHAETIRVVDAQMKEMAAQMRALDDFVARARSQNESHRDSHVASLQRLEGSVKEGYTAIGASYNASSSRTQDFQCNFQEQMAAAVETLAPLGSTIKEPLAGLRNAISSKPLTEYIPTGQTPPRTTYTYPTKLPKTAHHSTILSQSQPQRSSSKLRSPSKIAISSHMTSTSSAPASPSKAAVYTDSPANTTQSPIRPISADGPGANPGGLREININHIRAGNVNSINPFSQSLSSIPQSFINGAKKSPSDLNHNVENNVIMDLGKSVSSSMHPPPLKRINTGSNGPESKLPKFGPGKMRAEGRENVPVSTSTPILGVGTGRKLRSSGST
ncbi:kinesin motor protein cin8 [Agyrium rufum]|nr:kinesin motor protein cin8 [Agyrium rufum]